MKLFKAILSTSLVLGLLLSPLSFQKTVRAEENTEPYEVTVAFWNIQNLHEPIEGEGEDLLFADMTKRFPKIKFVPVPVSWSDAEQKINTWAASGQLPDLIGSVAFAGAPQMYQWIEGGLVRSIPESAENYPNIKKFLDLEEVQAFKVDNKNWFLPRMVYPDTSWWCMDRGLVVRKDWMEKLGIKDPKTEEDYIEMCRRFAQEDPDGNGENDTVGYAPIQPWILTSQGWPGLGYSDDRILVKEDGQGVYNAMASEQALHVGSFLRKMFKAGGMDPDFASFEPDTAKQKFCSGKAGILALQVTPEHLRQVTDAWKKNFPDQNAVDHITILPGPSVDGQYYRFVEKPFWSESWFNSNVDDGKMEELLKLYDYLYSDEGQEHLYFGMPDIDYKKTADGKIELLTEMTKGGDRHKIAYDRYSYSNINLFACWTKDLVQYNNPSIPQDVRDLCLKEREYRIKNWIQTPINWSLQNIQTPEKENIAAIKYNEDWVRFISDTSDTPDEVLYEQMKENWKANGYDEAMQSIYDKAKEEGIIK